MRECSRLLRCEFFQKYKTLEAAEIERLKQLYCKGPYVDQCVRKLFRELHGRILQDDITPEGKTLSAENRPPQGQVDG